MPTILYYTHHALFVKSPLIVSYIRSCIVFIGSISDYNGYKNTRSDGREGGEGRGGGGGLVVLLEGNELQCSAAPPNGSRCTVVLESSCWNNPGVSSLPDLTFRKFLWEIVDSTNASVILLLNKKVRFRRYFCRLFACNWNPNPGVYLIHWLLSWDGTGRVFLSSRRICSSRRWRVVKLMKSSQSSKVHPIAS